MGCDIHMHIEVKLHGIWEHYAFPNVSRDYGLFAKMAGVRDYGGEISPIALPKGIPDDASVVSRFDYERWAGDAHSASWLGIEEIEQLEDWLKETAPEYGGTPFQRNLEHGILKTYFFGNGFTDMKTCPEESIPGVEDVRFVFWFDN